MFIINLLDHRMILDTAETVMFGYITHQIYCIPDRLEYFKLYTSSNIIFSKAVHYKQHHF